MKYKWLALFLLIPTFAQGLQIRSKSAHVNFNTNKIIHLYGEVGGDMVEIYAKEYAATKDLSGPRVILINSEGGEVEAGDVIIKAMEDEKLAGVPQVCVVVGEATSMAFNILTHCGVRLATKSSIFLVHKVAVGSWPRNLRPTAKNMRLLANDLERVDERFRQANAKAMHLSLQQYDDNADEERTWFAPKLFQMGYLQGIVK